MDALWHLRLILSMRTTGAYDDRVGRAVADGGIGFALAGELHQVRTEVAVREVAVPGDRKSVV